MEAADVVLTRPPIPPFSYRSSSACEIRPKVVQTLIAESALNDPTGVVLALTFLGIVLTGSGCRRWQRW